MSDQVMTDDDIITRRTLEEIGAECGTDKARYRGAHDYCHTYDRLFTPLRDEPITLLELGWGGYLDPDEGGHSARMWREYFPKASINIIDIAPKNNTVPGVALFQGGQDDPNFLAQVHEQTGDYDIVVDDASHDSLKTIHSHSLIWPRVKPGGFYVVEDMFVQEAACRRWARLAQEHLLTRHKDVEWIVFFYELVVMRKASL